MLTVHPRALLDAATRARDGWVGADAAVTIDPSATRRLMAQSRCAEVCDQLGEVVAGCVDDTLRRVDRWAEATSLSADLYAVTDARAAHDVHHTPRHTPVVR